MGDDDDDDGRTDGRMDAKQMHAASVSFGQPRLTLPSSERQPDTVIAPIQPVSVASRLVRFPVTFEGSLPAHFI